MPASKYLHIAANVDVLPLLLDVHRHPELWDKNPCRLSQHGPHRETQDMFLRYKDETENVKSGNWENFADQHISIWNKSIDFLPTAKRIALDLMARVGGEQLGGVFIYRLPPGKRIYPHTDTGWHAAFYDKFNVCLQSNEHARFLYDGESFVQKQGDIHMFANNEDHWIVNEGGCDHIVMIVCIRIDRGERAPWSPEGWTLDNSLGAK